MENWYGVRIAVESEELDPRPPADPQALAALHDVEERLGATDPYRQLGQLAPDPAQATPGTVVTSRIRETKFQELDRAS
jgi:hypothetical protein